MRKHFLKQAAGAATLMGVLAMAGVPAQAADIRATVPFTFEVSKAVLGPGTYNISSGVAHGLVINGPRSGAVVLGTPMSSKNLTPRLVFHRYGDQYILREVWTGSTGNKLPETKRERELAAAQGGANTAAFERVEIPIL